jgi:hypothetical protein
VPSDGAVAVAEIWGLCAAALPQSTSPRERVNHFHSGFPLARGASRPAAVADSFFAISLSPMPDRDHDGAGAGALGGASVTYGFAGRSPCCCAFSLPLLPRARSAALLLALGTRREVSGGATASRFNNCVEGPPTQTSTPSAGGDARHPRQGVKTASAAAGNADREHDVEYKFGPTHSPHLLRCQQVVDLASQSHRSISRFRVAANWIGLYFGADGGYAWQSSRWSTASGALFWRRTATTRPDHLPAASSAQIINSTGSSSALRETGSGPTRPAAIRPLCRLGQPARFRFVHCFHDDQGLWLDPRPAWASRLDRFLIFAIAGWATGNPSTACALTGARNLGESEGRRSGGEIVRPTQAIDSHEYFMGIARPQKKPAGRAQPPRPEHSLANVH